MEIQTVKISGINPAKYNPRKDLKPGDSEYDKLKKSILEFDMVEPLVWNKQTGNLVGGHQRLKVLKELGVKKVDVSVVDLSEAKEKALNLALNKIQGEWDFPKLKDLLEGLDTGDFDMEITGFDDKEIVDLMSQFHEPTEGLTDDDAIPEDVETVCKTGGLWQLGNHRLLCGDATKKEDVERLMDGQKADMVFTDPPYNVDYGSSKNPRHKIRNLVGDKQTESEWLSFCAMVVANIKEYCDGDIYCWGAPGFEGMKQRLVFADFGAHWSATIIWNKDQLVLTPANYQRIYEPCFYGWFVKSSFTAGRKEVEVWDIPRPHDSKLHPTMKPVVLCEKGIGNSSMVNDGVLDIFGGSGSTLIACEKLGRRCFMMEIDEHYCDVIIQRWQNFTGREAIKL